MLKLVAKPTVLFRLGAWICTCMRGRYLPQALLEQIRPWRLFGLVCWCDRADSGANPPGPGMSA